MIEAGIFMLAIYIVDQERAIDLFWTGLAAIVIGICGIIFTAAVGPLALLPQTLLAFLLSWIVVGVSLPGAFIAGIIFFFGEICAALVLYAMFLWR